MSKENNVNVIRDLKAEVYDIVKEQGILSSKYNHLQEVKAKKIQELQELEKEERPKIN